LKIKHHFDVKCPPEAKIKVEVLEDGKRVLGIAHLFIVEINVADGRLLNYIKGAKEEIEQYHVDTTNNFLFHSENKTLQIRSVAPGGLKLEPKVIKLKYTPGSMFYIHDTQRLYCASFDNTLLFCLNPHTGELLDTIKGHPDFVNCLAWDTKYRTLYTSTHSTFRAYNPKDNQFTNIPDVKRIDRMITDNNGNVICITYGTLILTIMDRTGKVLYKTKLKQKVEGVAFMNGVICITQGLYVRFIYKNLLHYAAFALTAEDVKELITKLPHLATEADWFGNKPIDVAVARGDTDVMLACM